MGLIRAAGDENEDASTVDGNLTELCRPPTQPWRNTNNFLLRPLRCLTMLTIQVTNYR